MPGAMGSPLTPAPTIKALRIGAASALLATTVACGLTGREEAAPPEVEVSAVPALAPAVAPVVEGIPLATGFLPDPHIARGQAGGPREGRTMAPRVPLCRGWVPATPQHTITLTTPFERLRIIVNAQADTTLLIRGPDGQHRCADDNDGLNPIVEGAFAPGTYQVYVGAYSQGASTPYVIGLTERPSVTAESLGD